MQKSYTLQISTWFMCLASIGQAGATTTSAEASAFYSGTSVREAITAGAEGAQASANQVVPSELGDAFIDAQASSAAGVLHAAGVARTAGAPGGFQAQALAFWSDSFAFTAPGYDASMTGTFSGSVHVSGDLAVEFSGRTYTDTQMYADVGIFPDTGYNGGRVDLHGSARHAVGYDIEEIRTGSESQTLYFVDVPFTFGRPISVTFRLHVAADVNAIDPGASGRADANYGHTMSWQGLTAVRDQAGNLMTDYSARSSGSGFDFSSPVPEPATAGLALAGISLLGWVRRRRRGSRPCGRASG
ncbi:MAG: PEP-CTERM sorting domain-containing protein [Rubrivivax sp.]|nr:PEP-CTERM sorting domain-containing protein [Rubrivivax sp.]